jgi:hypothetical protein
MLSDIQFQMNYFDQLTSFKVASVAWSSTPVALSPSYEIAKEIWQGWLGEEVRNLNVNI